MKKVIASFSTVFLVALSAGLAQQTPEEVFKESAAAFNAGDAVKLLSMAPASFKEDLVSIVRTFGRNIDEELWNELRAVIADAAKAISSKSKAVAEALPTEEKLTVQEKDKRSKFLSEFCDAVVALATSKRTTLRGLRTVELEKLIKQINPVTQNLFSLTRVLHTEKISPEFKIIYGKKLANGDYEIAYKDDYGDRKENFRLFEGKWLPTELVEEWDELVKEVKDEIKSIVFEKDEWEEVKIMTQNVIKELKKEIEQLRATKDDDTGDLEEVAPRLMDCLMELIDWPLG